MTALTPEELEGRVNAHRELMIDLVAALMGGRSGNKSLRGKHSRRRQLSQS